MSATAPASAIEPNRWTRLNIYLHWLIVALIVIQYFIGESMVALFDAGIEGKAINGTTQWTGYLHLVVGLSILFAASIRLWDRFAHGRPVHSEREPNWAVRLSRITHFTLYALLLAMPVAGLTAFLLGNEWLGDQHVLASKVLLGVISLHVAGALTNHFWFKTDALRNMLPGRARSPDHR